MKGGGEGKRKGKAKDDKKDLPTPLLVTLTHNPVLLTDKIKNLENSKLEIHCTGEYHLQNIPKLHASEERMGF